MDFMIKDNKNDKIISSAKTIDELSDGYHTFKELYDFRREYNAALVNSGIWKAHKSYRHHDGELCFGGGWFIVMINTPFGQISNHYENEYWDEFHCEEKEVADEWDGHTEKDVLNRLHYSNKWTIKDAKDGNMFCTCLDKKTFALTRNLERVGLKYEDYNYLKWEDEPVEVFINLED